VRQHMEIDSNRVYNIVTFGSPSHVYRPILLRFILHLQNKPPFHPFGFLIEPNPIEGAAHSMDITLRPSIPR
jgi:hypothetical protein